MSKFSECFPASLSPTEISDSGGSCFVPRYRDKLCAALWTALVLQWLFFLGGYLNLLLIRLIMWFSSKVSEWKIIIRIMNKTAKEAINKGS